METPDHRRVYEADFSGAADAGKRIRLAGGTLDGEVLRIDESGRRKDRLRDLYVMGDVPRDEYTVLKSDLERQIADLEWQFGGAGYPRETVLARIGQLGVLLREGTAEQQKRALGLVFKRILVGLDGKIKAVEPPGWA